MAIENHKQVLFLGDLNFRINALSRDEVLTKVQTNKLKLLLEEDDLHLAFKNYKPEKYQENIYMDHFLRNFKEGKISFIPTYKFDVGTSVYDSSKKQRVPAYCDRILFKRNNILSQLKYYACMGVKFSDHKPVIGSFVLNLEDTLKKAA